MKVGFVGWRGMVGSVLMDRMSRLGDLDGIHPSFFSTSQAGLEVSISGLKDKLILEDATEISRLSDQDIIVTCQGSEYTRKTYDKLREMGWNGYWIDAASELRMKSGVIIALDPVNGKAIEEGLSKGIKTFVGGNCTVSLMLLAMQGLLQEGKVEWISSMTYQAASGAGANCMQELASQMGVIGESWRNDLSAIETEEIIRKKMLDKNFPTSANGSVLAGGLIPWIDADLGNGQSREEWKGQAEAAKILNDEQIKVDGICVRIGTFRCHAQALVFKLNSRLSVEEVENMLRSGNEWVKIIKNIKGDSVKELSPVEVSGGLSIPVGRLRKLSFNENIYTGFTLGDQLLWGAAEPLRRVLKIILGKAGSLAKQNKLRRHQYDQLQ